MALPRKRKEDFPDQLIKDMVAYYQANKAEIHAQCRRYNFMPEHFRMFRQELLQRMCYRKESIQEAIANVLDRMQRHAHSITPVTPLRFHPDGTADLGDWDTLIANAMR